MDAPEAGDKARVARRDAPEREIGKLEVDGLLGETGKPRVLQVFRFRIPVWDLRCISPDRYPHQSIRIGTSVVGFGDRERDMRLLRHVLRVPGEAADVDMEGAESRFRQI